MRIKALPTAILHGFWDFLAWWRDELLVMLPVGLRGALAPRTRRIEVLPDDGELLVIVSEQGVEIERKILTEDGLGDDLLEVLKGRRVDEAVVELGGAEILRTTAEVPLLKRQKVEKAIRYQAARLFPFPAGKGLIGYRRINDSTSERAGVEVLALKSEGVIGGVVRCLADHVPELHLGLEGRTYRLVSEADKPPPRLALGLGGRTLHLLVITSLFVALAAAVHWRAWSRAEALAAEAKSVSERASNLIGLQNRLLDHVTLVRSTGRLIEKARIARVLEELSRLIPDGAWVRSLEIDGLRVSLQGFAEDLPNLLEKLAGSEVFENAKLLNSQSGAGGEAKTRFEVEVFLRVGGETG